MNCWRVVLIANLVLLTLLGIISFRSTPYTIEKEFRIPAHQLEKVCVDEETNVLHILEDKHVTLTASHDNFAIVDIEGRKNILSGLLSVKYGNFLPDIDIYGHLVDAKRDRENVNLVITPFRHSCYMVLNEDEASDLVVDMHVESKLCYITVFFFAMQILLSLFYPSAMLYEIIVFCLMVCTLALIDLIPSSIRDRSFFVDYIAPYIIIPLDRTFCFVILLIVHSSIRVVDFVAFALSALLPSLALAWDNVSSFMQMWYGRVRSAALRCISVLGDKEQLLTLGRVYWKEILVTGLSVLLSCYVVFPSPVNITVEIRVMCCILLIGGIAYVSKTLAVITVFYSTVIGIAVLLLQSRIKDIIRLTRNVINRQE